MDRFVLRSLDDFWALVDRHRRELSLRDLGLRRERAPHVDTVFVALKGLGLSPRWSGAAAMIDALRRRTVALSWSSRELADKIGINIRSAERLLAGGHTPTFTVALRWADAVDQPFYIDADASLSSIDPGDGASSAALVVDEPSGASADSDSSVPGPPAATAPATPPDATVPGPQAATASAGDDDSPGHADAIVTADATDQATPADTSGPRPARPPSPPTGAAILDDTPGQESGATGPVVATPVATNLSIGTCPIGHDTIGHPLGEADDTGPVEEDDDAVEIDTIGHDISGDDASTPDLIRAEAIARKEALRAPPARPQGEPMMAKVEWRRGDEVIFRGEVARDQVLPTLRAMRKAYAGATPFVDGKRVGKKRRRRSDELRAQIGAEMREHFLDAVRPLMDGQRALAARQEAMERQADVTREVAEGLKDLKNLVAPTRPPSYLAHFAQALLEEFSPKEDPT